MADPKKEKPKSAESKLAYMREYNKKRRSLNLPKDKEYIGKTREKRNIYLKEYYAKNKENLKQYQKYYKKLNRGIVNAQNSKRRAQKLLATPLWVLTDKEELSKIEEIYKEAARLTETSGIIHHVDHIIPLVNPLVCGLHVWNNFAVIPKVDNLRKGNYHPVHD